MEYHINKVETNKNLADLKHKLAALDGIMQAGSRSICPHDTDAPINESNSELKS